jgi:hypothetical protein
VAPAGDIDDDGHEDLIVGAPTNDLVAGFARRAYLFHGPVSGQIGLAQADAVISGLDFEELGWSAAAGDMNGGQLPDLLIGASQWNASVGRAYVFYSPAVGSGTSSSADAIIEGVMFTDYLGTAVAVADINGDAIGDAIITAPHDPAEIAGPGLVYVFFGRVTGLHRAAAADVVVRGEADDDRFGISASSGDLDGDDTTDLVVGADDIHGSTPGEAYLFLGPLAGDVFASSADAEITGESPDDVFGCSVAADGDAHGDGFDDVLPSFSLADPGGGCDSRRSGVTTGREPPSPHDDEPPRDRARPRSEPRQVGAGSDRMPRGIPAVPLGRPARPARRTERKTADEASRHVVHRQPDQPVPTRTGRANRRKIDGQREADRLRDTRRVRNDGERAVEPPRRLLPRAGGQRARARQDLDAGVVAREEDVLRGERRIQRVAGRVEVPM